MTDAEFRRRLTRILDRYERWGREMIDFAALCDEHGTDHPGLRARFEQIRAERAVIGEAIDTLVAEWEAAKHDSTSQHNDQEDNDGFRSQHA